MFGRDMVTVLVLIDRGVVGVRILLARMLGFGHDGRLGISAFSMALENASCTSDER